MYKGMRGGKRERETEGGRETERQRETERERELPQTGCNVCLPCEACLPAYFRGRAQYCGITFHVSVFVCFLPALTALRLQSCLKIKIKINERVLGTCESSVASADAVLRDDRGHVTNTCHST